MEFPTMRALGMLGLVAALAACGGKKEEPATAGEAPPQAAAPVAEVPPASGGSEPFIELFEGVKLVRLPQTEGGDALQVVLPPQSDADKIPNGPVEVRISAGEQELAKGYPRALYRCPKSIRSMRFKATDLAAGLKVDFLVADPKAIPPLPQVKPTAEKGAKAAGAAPVKPMTPEQAGIDPDHPGAAKGLPIGAPIPGLSAVVPAEKLQQLKIPAQGERLVKESCG